MQLALYIECLAAGRHEQAEAWVRVIQPDDSAYEMCRRCGFLRQVSTPPDLAAMKRVFVAAWPWLACALDKDTAEWHDAGVNAQTRLPDEPFIAALHAAWGEAEAAARIARAAAEPVKGGFSE